MVFRTRYFKTLEAYRVIILNRPPLGTRKLSILQLSLNRGTTLFLFKFKIKKPYFICKNYPPISFRRPTLKCSMETLVYGVFGLYVSFIKQFHSLHLLNISSRSEDVRSQSTQQTPFKIQEILYNMSFTA